MEERRADYPRILDAVNEIKTDMAKVATLVEERNQSALQWRGDVCKKFDRIFTWLDSLPCKERQERSKNQQIFDGLLWGAIGVTFTILVIHLGWR